MKEAIRNTTNTFMKDAAKILPNSGRTRRYTPPSESNSHFKKEDFALDVTKFLTPGKTTLTESNYNNLKLEAQEKMKKNNIVLFANTPFRKAEEMKYWTDLISSKSFDNIEGSVIRNKKADNIYDVGVAPHIVIPPHPENAFASIFPKFISFGILTAPGEKIGATHITSNIEYTQDLLSTKVGQKLRDLGVTYYRNMTSKNDPTDKLKYLNWQTSLKLEKKEDVEKYMNERYEKWHWGPNDSLHFQMDTDAFVYYDEIDSNVAFFSLASHAYWFDDMEEYRFVPDLERPNTLGFGDGTMLTVEEVEEINALTEKASFPLYWEQGDIAIVNNYMWMHARVPYTLKPGQKRDLAVKLIEKQDRTRMKPGKWDVLNMKV